MSAVSSISPSLSDRLMAPALWYQRHMTQIFTEPLPAENKGWEIAARIVEFVALIALGALLILAIPLALLGWANRSVTHVSAPVQQPAPSAVDKAAVTAEAGRLKALYDNLQDLYSDEAQQLFRGIQEFKNKFDSYRNPDASVVDDLTKSFNLFDQLEANAKSLQAALECWEGDPKQMIEQPRDGNCWLHTALVGLTFLNHPLRLDLTHQTLRPQVVAWMETNQHNPDLKRFLENALEAHRFKIREALLEEEISLSILDKNSLPSQELQYVNSRLEEIAKALTAIDQISLPDYFNDMRKVGTHGSHAELYAIAEMFEVNVAVWREILPTEQYPKGMLTKKHDEQLVINGQRQTIHVVLTREGNHFNSRLPPRN